MIFLRTSGVLLLLCVLAGTACRADDLVPPDPQARTHGPSPEISQFQNSAKMEIYRLRIVNDSHGLISGSRDCGASWVALGHVLTYTQKVAEEGYTASKWAPLSAVAATAVNAMHIRTGYNAAKDRGVVFSIMPVEILTEMGRKLQSFYSPDASIYTDIPAGTLIFGSQWAPILGNPVELERGANLVPMPLNYVPQRGDVFVIRVLQPMNSPMEFVFENRFGGFITVVDWEGHQQLIGQVLKPVQGVGRFTGTQYAAPGRLRANHNGVIDISVSPHGCIGGFQIIPREHAMSPEMTRARTMTQWMVVGPLDARDPSWEGVAPLFRDYLHPNWSDNDWDGPDWLQRVTSRVLIEVRIKNGPWQPVPQFSFDPDLNKPLPDWANTALEDVTHVRIVLPVPENLQR